MTWDSLAESKRKLLSESRWKQYYRYEYINFQKLIIPLNLFFTVKIISCSISYLFCVRNFPKTWQLKTTNIYYLPQFPKIRNLGVASLYGFGSGSLRRDPRVCNQAVVSLRPYWNQRICFQVHSVECWYPSFVCHVNFSWVLYTWQLFFPKARDPRERNCLRWKLQVFIS